jgi:hypothetical protein
MEQLQEDSGIPELPEDLTIPRNLQLSARAFPDVDLAREVIHKLHSILSVLSKYINLTNLDGVTIAYDYDEALAELDRGYETTYELTATKDVAIGVAMAPTVVRNGTIKTHLVINANLIVGILDSPGRETVEFSKSLHLIAHECAHVKVTAAFDKAFPGMLLQRTYDNALDNMRWQVILSAWDEYAVCRIAGSIGIDPAEDYLEILLKVLTNARTQCFESIRAYRLHGDVGRVTAEVYGKLGDLLKFSSYYLGAISAHDIPQTYPLQLVEEDEFKWFRPYYDRLMVTQSQLWDQFGKWEVRDCFESVGDILEDMAESVGIQAKRISNQETWFEIPYRKESMPLEDDCSTD